MNNRLEWAYNSPYPRSLHYQSSEDSTAVTRVTTTIALLVLGYYALSFFELWPSTFRRRAYETFLDFIPPQLLVLMQSVMARVSFLSRDSTRFRVEDLSSRQAKSDVLRQLLGLENSRITTVVRKARTFSGIDNILPPSTEIGPAGLGNWDNSCYQNSVLHGFASMPAFYTFVSKSWDLMRQQDTTAPTHEALASFLGKLNALDQPKKTLWTPGVLKSMDSWQQQDAQEYFSRVLDAVEKEDARFYRRNKRKDGLEIVPAMKERDTAYADAKVSDKSEKVSISASSTKLPQKANGHLKAGHNTIAGYPARNPLDGMLAQSLKCSACGFSEGLSLTQFNCITVNLGTAGGSCTLDQLFDEYTEAENIDGVECTQCTTLAHPAHETTKDEAVNAETTTSTERRDESLTQKTTRKKRKPVLSTKSKQLTIGRLPEDLVIHLNRSIFDMYGNQRKNTAFVEFPLHLSILSRWCAPLDDVDGRAVQAAYMLRCVVTHAGRHDDGHYIAYSKRGKDWFCFNDEVVTKVSEEFVSNRGNAFMLFYERDYSLAPFPETMPPEGLMEETFEDASAAASAESEASEHCESMLGAQEPEDVNAPTQAQSSIPEVKPPVLLPYSPIVSSEGMAEDPIPSSAGPSDADAEDKPAPQPWLEALIPPMRTASESSAMHQRMETSYAAPVF